MTRTRHFLKGLSSGYLLLAVNAISTFISLPLALHYLSRPQFNIWIVAGQAATYLAMIDLGMASAGYRLLMDHKDAPGGGAYGGMIKSLMLAQWIQAALILVIGWAGGSVLNALLEIPPAAVDDFNVLWGWLVLFLAINFALRIGNLILMAHQRLDISNYAQLGSQVLNLLIVIVAFRSGLQLYSLILAQGISTLVMLAWTLVACVRLKLLPPPGAWGAVSLEHLRSLFSFGAEVFLVTIGTMFIYGTQVFLLTRFLSLDAASLWAVMTKIFTLLTQLVWRTIAGAIPAFSEMFVRGELGLLRKRYRSLLALSLLGSCYCGLLIGFGNNAFVEVWTPKPFRWEPVNSWLLAIWFLLLTEACCHTSLVLYSKRVQWLKFIYLVEGAAFVLASFVVIPRYGITGMLFCSISCSALLASAYGRYRVSRLLGESQRDMTLEWLRPVARFLVTMLPIGIVLGYFTRDSAWLRLMACVVPLSIIGALVIIRFCAPREILLEVLAHLPKPLRRIGAALGGI